jgi:hypothetical protein
MGHGKSPKKITIDCAQPFSVNGQGVHLKRYVENRAKK